MRPRARAGLRSGRAVTARGRAQLDESTAAVERLQRDNAAQAAQAAAADGAFKQELAAITVRSAFASAARSRLPHAKSRLPLRARRGTRITSRGVTWRWRAGPARGLAQR